MRTNRMLSILGLAVAIPMLVASMAFACEKSCSGKTSAASVKSASTAAAQTAAPAGGTAACPVSSCAGKASAKSAAACGPDCAKECCAPKTASTCGADCEKACCAGKAAAMITYKVSGMTCMGCVKQVESAVAKLELENVQKVAVNLDDHNAVLTTSGPVDAAAIATAITKAGFEAKVASAERTEKATDEKAETKDTASTM